MSRGGAYGRAQRPRFAVMAALLLMALAVATVVPAARAGDLTGPRPGQGTGPAPGPDTAPPAEDSDARPEHDADASRPRPDGQRPRPRLFDDGNRAPRADEGCPYRGRKLDLIV